MRVLFDVFELTPDGGKSMGIYHYARNVWQEFVAALPDDMSLVLACHGRNESDFPAVSHPRVERVLLHRCATDKRQGKGQQAEHGREGREVGNQ